MYYDNYEPSPARSNRDIISDLIAKAERHLGLKDILSKSLYDNISRSIKTRYGQEIYLTADESESAKAWIEKYDPKYNKRLKNRNGALMDTKFIIKLDTATYCEVSVGKFIDLLNPYLNNNNDNGGRCPMKLYFFGKKYRTYVNEFDGVISKRNTGRLFLYDIKGKESREGELGIDSVGRYLKERALDSIFLNPGVKEEVIDHIENFLNNRHIYEEKDITYKTGILLYGTPGTGKTSLASALATWLRYNLVVLDLSTFGKLDISSLTACINEDSDNFVILLEDIDTIFPSLDRQDKELDADTRNVINKMLQFLDSSSSPNNVIFIATTNDISKLDEAILREGRFDLKVPMTNIHPDVALTMLESFNIPSKDAKSIITKLTSKGEADINPSMLQNEAIKYFKKGVQENNDEK